MSKQKITDYKIIKDTWEHAVCGYVKLDIEKGWQPLGGVAIEGNYYAQAMVKYEQCKVEDER